MDVEKLKKLVGGSVRNGGKGSMRRKKKSARKNTTTGDDKNLQAAIKKAEVMDIPNVQEVNIFKNDCVIQIVNPKVQGNVATNTWVFSGTPNILPHTLEHSDA